MDRLKAFELIELHPTETWAKKVVKTLSESPDEEKKIWEDKDFQKQIENILFQAQVNIMIERKNSMLLSSNKGGWQGLDKMLQEMDDEMFSIKQKHELGKGSLPTTITINGQGVE